MKYFKPKSLTWWCGLVLAAALPVLKYIGVDIPVSDETITTILTGLGLVGLRAAVK